MLSRAIVASGVRALDTTRFDEPHIGQVFIAAEREGDPRAIAGQRGGVPLWIQPDETPAGYRFIAMLEESPAGFNFGDGCAYVFADDERNAKVLWQGRLNPRRRRGSPRCSRAGVG